ncbi:MAG: pilin [Patescibacteria group bacterium]|nr:pilin [Patescibacteria group bacterium]
MKKILKSLMVLAVALTIISPLSVIPAMAIDINDVTQGPPVPGVPAVQSIGSVTGLSVSDPRTIAANIIKIALGFLGVLAVVIILIGGFKWMTAAGNEEQIEEAKKVLMAGIIGLVIILASWGIANFVLSSLISSI